MKLIDADALSRAMYHEAFETDGDWQRWDSGLWIRYKMFENALESAPTIEAVPARRGQWVIENDGTVMHCDVCGWAYEYYAGLEEENNYCPHCGAKMERRADEGI